MLHTSTYSTRYLYDLSLVVLYVLNNLYIPVSSIYLLYISKYGTAASFTPENSIFRDKRSVRLISFYTQVYAFKFSYFKLSIKRSTI